LEYSKIYNGRIEWSEAVGIEERRPIELVQQARPISDFVRVGAAKSRGGSVGITASPV